MKTLGRLYFGVSENSGYLILGSLKITVWYTLALALKLRLQTPPSEEGCTCALELRCPEDQALHTGVSPNLSSLSLRLHVPI